MKTPRRLLFECQIDHEPASKANQRRIVHFGKRVVSIKSEKAMRFTQAVKNEVKSLPELITDDILIDITVFYASRRPDLDESVILDALQGIAYANDRQVKCKVIRWGCDPLFPRCLVKIFTLQEGDCPGHQGRCIRGKRAKARSSRLAG